MTSHMWGPASFLPQGPLRPSYATDCGFPVFDFVYLCSTLSILICEIVLITFSGSKAERFRVDLKRKNVFLRCRCMHFSVDNFTV